MGTCAVWWGLNVLRRLKRILQRDLGLLAAEYSRHLPTTRGIPRGCGNNARLDVITGPRFGFTPFYSYRDVANPSWVHATLINCVSSLRHKRLVSDCCFGLIIMDLLTTSLLFNGGVLGGRVFTDLRPNRETERRKNLALDCCLNCKISTLR
ncbi:hypothetical protein TcasGA2_TC011726 [Tribolium castaneum]|uniref:Uncharacterized protein n=1 Tax=Tribolium castaneum TaxID=7070 RepID=D6X0A0_TRICA|nr:hypothetical protein TcasGA2_TC011726 [Tribolium castaneum]